MANISESASFDDAIYQISITDPVLGGAGGIANLQAQSLGNRTLWLKNQVDALSARLPPGIILMWSGAVNAIPVGWALCDGQNGTPDLHGRFVVGVGGTYAAGATGGSKDAVVVAHSHTVTGYKNGDYQPPNDVYSLGSNGAEDGTQVFATSVTGESGVDKNLPPYYALCYIQLIG